MENSASLFNVIPYSSLVNWSVRFLQQQHLRYKREFRLFKIGDFLKRSIRPISIENDQEYKQVTIKLFNKGVVPRGVNFGKDIGTKKQYLVSTGQFIISKIDARNGAFGIVPDELDGAVVTADFVPYEIILDKIDPEFLVLLTGTQYFASICQNSSSGTTGRQRIKELEFLQIQIPLPDLTTQKAIASAFNTKTKDALTMDNKADCLEIAFKEHYFNKLNVIKNIDTIKGNGLQFVGFRDLSRWALSYITKNSAFSFHNTAFKVVAIREVLSLFEGGKTPSKSRNDYWDNGHIAWTSPKDFNGLYLTETQDKITDAAVEESKMKIYPQGTILGVFRSGILRHSFPVMLTQIETSINQDLKAMLPDRNKVNSLYLLYYLNLFQGMILERASKVGVTVESINVEEFLEVPIILPPLDVQIHIALEVKAQKDNILKLRASALENRKQAAEQFEKTIFHQ